MVYLCNSGTVSPTALGFKMVGKLIATGTLHAGEKPST